MTNDMRPGARGEWPSSPMQTGSRRVRGGVLAYDGILDGDILQVLDRLVALSYSFLPKNFSKGSPQVGCSGESCHCAQ